MDKWIHVGYNIYRSCIPDCFRCSLSSRLCVLCERTSVMCYANIPGLWLILAGCNAVYFQLGFKLDKVLLTRVNRFCCNSLLSPLSDWLTCFDVGQHRIPLSPIAATSVLLSAQNWRINQQKKKEAKYYTRKNMLRQEEVITALKHYVLLYEKLSCFPQNWIVMQSTCYHWDRRLNWNKFLWLIQAFQNVPVGIVSHL